jgi:hypothetical protein
MGLTQWGMFSMPERMLPLNGRIEVRNRMRKWAVSFLRLAACGVCCIGAILQSGCIAIAAVGAGASAAVYLRGSMESHLQADFPTSVEAVRKGAPRVGLVKEREVSERERARFVFTDATGKPVTIQLRKRDYGVTEISIRVGTLGDENRSLQLLNVIHQEL